IFFLADRGHPGPRAASAELGAAVASTVNVTSGVAGRAARVTESDSWALRKALGLPRMMLQNVSRAQYRGLAVPLRAGGAESAPRGSWRAFVAVGGPDLAGQPAQCVLEQLGPPGTGVIGSSGREAYDATYDAHSGTIELLLPHGTPAAETQVRCFVPPQGWVGDVIWHHASNTGPAWPEHIPDPNPVAENG